VEAEAVDHEFELTLRDFDRVRRLIRERAGISLSPGKRNMVYSRLSRRLRILGLDDFSGYLDGVESGELDEDVEFINALTTNLTSFWREAHHFPMLAAHLKRRSAHGPLKAWCCAASTGEEPYTIAITALQAGVASSFKLLATDIDTNVLETARSGVYSLDRLQGVDPETVKRYFMKGRGANEGKTRVRPEVAALAEFRQLNLLAPSWPVRGPFSVIFCRNVMIYFDKPTQHAVLRRLADLLEPGGLLFAGHSENFSEAKDWLRACGRTVYERCN
jgi:chemotaxis protein methyltransferase CheR